jgi:two-component system phosphate regulon sensor histidine kinase PhoR
MSATAAPTTARRRRGRRRTAALLAKRRVQVALATLLALLVALLVVGLVGAIVLYRSSENRYADIALPLQTLNRDVLFRLTEEETGVRGYMLTTERRSLEPYFEGRDALAQDLAKIRKLTQGRPQLATRTREVEQQAQSLRAFYDKLITFVADGQEGREKAALDVLDGELRAAEFRRTLGLMQNDVDVFIAETHAAQHRTYVLTLTVLSVAGALALSIAALMLRRVPERLRRAYAEQEQGAQASRALAHVSEAVFLVDDAETIRYWNRAAEQLYGVAADDAIGSPVRSVVVDYDELVEAAAHDDRFVPVLLEGAERWLSPVLRELDGGSVVAVRDATAAYALERARTDFVATASHELRTPLTAVYGGAATLLARREQLSPSQQDRLLRLITQEAEHLTVIVDQLIVSAQLDRGTLRVTDEECDVAAVCRAVVDAAQLRATPGRMIALERPTALAPLRCDATLLRQVLANLVDNALKYSETDVLVRVTDGTSSVRIEVTDRGPGVPASEQERIFEKFFRLDADMATGVGGSGLGLYISREIVSQLGGTLIVESRAGRGSTFAVTLPRRA